MMNAERCNGRTSLTAVTYVPVTDTHTNHGEGDIQVRIRRRTLFCLRGGSKWTRSQTYSLTIDNLETLDASLGEKNKLCWLSNLIDLILRRTDRAFLRVQAVLAQHVIRDREEPEWLPPRQPNYLQVLSPMMVKGEVPANGENMCGVCLEMLDESSPLIQLRCPGPIQHKLHMSCIIKVCEALGPAQAFPLKCPLCRQIVTDQNPDLDYLQYGCRGKNYVVDSRYSDWENFERSCSDVDKYLAENVDQRIKVSSVLLKAIFEILVEGARKEPAVSTAFNLQMVRCAEAGLLEQAVVSAAKSMEGIYVESSTLFKAILTDLLSSCTAAFKTGGLVPTLDSDELAEWAAAELDMTEALRPGYYAWAQKMVSRTCEFVRVRACKCDFSGAFENGFHSHGGRVYYNPHAKAWRR